jgi:deoxyribodipyrimidine photo-lyase
VAKSSRIREISATDTNLSQFYELPAAENLLERGGRTRAREILASLRNWRDYNNMRDLLTYNTTHLSPFNKFGCISCREVFHAMHDKLGTSSDLIGQMIWRDFFYNLSFNHPEIYRQAMNPRYANIKWPENAETHRRFTAWCQARTGYPIVDACMREINTTGYMHNRGRLIVANFLSRLLQVDWRRGEHYFAKTLYDYDPAQNNFGWQICATVSGTESRPLNQTIFNPWLQSAKYDPDAEYIKKWLPELKDIPATKLHRWSEFGEDILKNDKTIKYILPIVNYTDEKEENLKLYGKYK